MMSGKSFFNEAIEAMERGDLDALVDESIHYTVTYANEHSPFYRRWFRERGIKANEIRSHEDLLELPIISGQTIREHQPPETADFEFKSVDWNDVFTLHETSGTSGTPKAFFQYKPRLAEAYAENTFKIIFNFTGPGDLELYRVKGRPKRIVGRR